MIAADEAEDRHRQRPLKFGPWDMAIDLVAIVKKPRWRDVCLKIFPSFRGHLRWNGHPVSGGDSSTTSSALKFGSKSGSGSRTAQAEHRCRDGTAGIDSINGANLTQAPLIQNRYTV